MELRSPGREEEWEYSRLSLEKKRRRIEKEEKRREKRRKEREFRDSSPTKDEDSEVPFAEKICTGPRVHSQPPVEEKPYLL